MIMKGSFLHGADYGEKVDYLIFRHDERNRSMVLDEDGNRDVRSVYRIDGICCTPSAFPFLARETDLRYRKNLRPEDCNMIHLVLSYHPRDMMDGLLDVSLAHELSQEWIHRYLPGFLGVACTHEDGDHHSGNIHTHILLHSVKCRNEVSPYMTHPENSRVGNRFHLSPITWMELRQKLNEFSGEKGLHQDYSAWIPPDSVNDREYHARYVGQKKLEENNRKIIEAGGIPETDTFHTEKETYRIAIRDASRRSCSVTEFKEILGHEHGILVTEDQGKWRYVKDRGRGYSPGTLGSSYFREKVLEELEKNRKDPHRVEEYLTSEKYREQNRQIALKKDSLPGYIRTLSPPFRDDLSGDICRLVYDRGMALDTREEQVRFFRPYAEAVRWIYWCGYPFAMTLEKLDHVAEDNRRDLTRSQENVELCRRKHVEKETLLFYSCAVRDYAPLKEQIANAEDPDAFREEHWMEFRILEEAEEQLGRIPGKTWKERQEETLLAGKALFRAQNDLNSYEDFQEELRQVVSVLEPIRPDLEKLQDERENRNMEQEQEVRKKEERESIPKKRVISPDYER